MRAYAPSMMMQCSDTRHAIADVGKAGAGAGKGDDGEDDAGGNEGDAQKEAAADWEESEGEGDGEEAGTGAKFSKPRSRRKMWQLEDDMQLLIVYAQAGMCLCVEMCLHTGCASRCLGRIV